MSGELETVTGVHFNDHGGYLTMVVNKDVTCVKKRFLFGDSHSVVHDFDTVDLGFVDSFVSALVEHESDLLNSFDDSVVVKPATSRHGLINTSGYVLSDIEMGKEIVDSSYSHFPTVEGVLELIPCGDVTIPVHYALPFVYNQAYVNHLDDYIDKELKALQSVVEQGDIYCVSILLRDKIERLSRSSGLFLTREEAEEKELDAQKLFLENKKNHDEENAYFMISDFLPIVTEHEQGVSLLNLWSESLQVKNVETQKKVQFSLISTLVSCYVAVKQSYREKEKMEEIMKQAQLEQKNNCDSLEDALIVERINSQNMAVNMMMNKM